jgi:excinuclease ABC subunit C
MKKEIFKKIKLPNKPGVYFFLKDREIIYIGKATSLRDRAKSYFGEDLIETRGPIILDMIFRADKIDWQVTDSVLEAIILEANLIKKHQPKYNTKEKSDKSFNYVCITKEKLPRVIIVRGKDLDNFTNQKFSRVLGSPGPHTPARPTRKSLIGSVFGPFPNSPQLREALKIIRPIFPFLDDKSKNYYKFYKQVDLVPDISNTGGIKQYKKNIKNLKLFFEGKKKKVLKNLEKEMKEYAKVREFEKAGEVKRQIFALKHINDIALIKNENEKQDNAFRIEAYDIAHMGGKNMVGVMVVVSGGEIEKSEYKKFKIRTQNNANDTGALKEVLERRLAHKEWTYPNLIVVDGGIAQINITKKILIKLNINIPVVSVLKDEHHKPKAIMGDKEIVLKHKRAILLANSEAHRFAINYHKNMRDRNFLG